MRLRINVEPHRDFEWLLQHKAGRWIICHRVIIVNRVNLFTGEILPDKNAEWECGRICAGTKDDALATFRMAVREFIRMAGLGPSRQLARSMAYQEAAWEGPAADLETLEQEWFRFLNEE